MANYPTLSDVNVKNQHVLVRVDINVPIDNGGTITDTTRLEAVKSTINELAERDAKVILMAHFGRPKGTHIPSMSLQNIVPALAKTLGHPVIFIDDCIGDKVTSAIHNMIPGEIILLENTRFYEGEEKNDPAFSEALAINGDLYINDAFSASHRAHASTVGIAKLLPSAAGRAMQGELDALTKALGKPEHPVAAVIGGAKISTKIDLLKNLVKKVDILVIGGGMANTFLKAKGVNIGKSLCEQDKISTALEILDIAANNQCEIILPEDAVIAPILETNAHHQIVTIKNIPEDMMILDIGPASIDIIKKKIGQAKTVLWNGPLGAFEIPPFDKATVAVACYVAEQTNTKKLLSIAGGGDTIAALNHAKAAQDFSYISTAGGAFLEWLEGKPLPGVEILYKRDPKNCNAVQ